MKSNSLSAPVFFGQNNSANSQYWRANNIARILVKVLQQQRSGSAIGPPLVKHSARIVCLRQCVSERVQPAAGGRAEHTQHKGERERAGGARVAAGGTVGTEKRVSVYVCVRVLLAPASSSRGPDQLVRAVLSRRTRAPRAYVMQQQRASVLQCVAPTAWRAQVYACSVSKILATLYSRIVRNRWQTLLKHNGNSFRACIVLHYAVAGAKIYSFVTARAPVARLARSPTMAARATLVLAGRMRICSRIGATFEVLHMRA